MQKTTNHQPVPHPEQAPRICLGKIVGVHGLKGLVKVHIYAENPDILLEFPLYAGQTATNTLKITLKNPQGTVWLAAIDGVSDRTAAENYKNIELWTDRTALPAADEGEFYYHDLIGLEVRDENSQKIGTIRSVDNFGAGDLIEIQPLMGDSFYLPFTDALVPTVDLTQGFVTARNTDDYRI